MRVPETAMVLAAGQGKRMRPISAATPKPLVRVGGRALIDHCLDGLAAAGVKRAVVNVRHLADQIESHLKDRPSPKVTISDERDAELETGGGVKRALPLLGDGAFLLRNSDSFWLEGVRPNLHWLAGGWDEATHGRPAAACLDGEGGRLLRTRRFHPRSGRPAGAPA